MTLSNLWEQGTAVRARRFYLAANDEMAGLNDATEHADLYAEGFAEGRRVVEQEFQADRAMLLELITCAATIERPDPQPLATLMFESVLGLVEDIVGRAPVDATLLQKRALVLATAICGPSESISLSVRPENIDLLAGLCADIELRADPSLAPGALRLNFGESSAEDGPVFALERLRTAMRVLETS